MSNQVTIWLEQDSLDFLISSKNKLKVCNMNVFKQDPVETTYDSHNPIKIRVTIEYL